MSQLHELVLICFGLMRHRKSRSVSCRPLANPRGRRKVGHGGSVCVRGRGAESASTLSREVSRDFVALGKTLVRTLPSVLNILN